MPNPPKPSSQADGFGQDADKVIDLMKVLRDSLKVPPKPVHVNRSPKGTFTNKVK